MIIPFFIPHAGCPHQCVFCNQKNITGQTKSVAASSVPQRIEEYLRTADAAPVRVAFYGGSFTALPMEMQREYLEAAFPYVKERRIAGIRVSTRPDSISTEVLALLKSYHVDTVELGVQSMDDSVLALSGRGHTASDTIQAARLLHEWGFTVGLQLMPGLPGDTEEGFGHTIEITIALRPAFVRLYPALVIKDTPLESLYREGRFLPLSLEEAVARCRNAMLRFEEAGIMVIRMGLQPTEELEKPGTVVAGPYHPAFRQVVESSILFERMRALLNDSRRSVSEAAFLVHPRDLSTAIGQNRCNLTSLHNEFGLTVHVLPEQSVPRRTVILAASKKRC